MAYDYLNEIPRPETLEQAFVIDDVCPRCLGELDDGWECNGCDFDAYPIACRVFDMTED